MKVQYAIDTLRARLKELNGTEQKLNAQVLTHYHTFDIYELESAIKILEKENRGK